MAYPTLRIDIEEYEWFINVYEMTEREKQLISKNVKEDNNEGVLDVIVGLIKDWNCTNRAGEPLPISRESLEELPQSIIERIITNSANPKRTALSPKLNSSSLPATPSEVVASVPETNHASV